jgi:Flp pilus assembly protein TadD
MKGALDSAVTSFGRASELAPDDSKVHANLGLVLARLSRWAESEYELERALVLDTDNDTARKALARVLVHRGERLVMDGELAGAVPHFQRAVKLDPAFNAAQQDLVETLMRLQKSRVQPPVGEGPPTHS